MDVFGLRERLIHDYSNYASSFIQIRDQRLYEAVQQSLSAGVFWPDPLIQLNPSFESGGTVRELVAAGILHEECSRIFLKDKQKGGQALRFHRHQREAIEIARQGHNYILTTGTGSGKSLAYIVPIVDHVLRRGRGRGIQAIIVYPMNALANSQAGELEKFLNEGYPLGQSPVTFARYTGQESEEERQRIITHPPDILLTNYVMLELIMTRPRESTLIERARGLRFLVLDELHTYRGRQGADVALLVRRVRDRLETPEQKLLFVGTSATLAGEGSYDEQRRFLMRCELDALYFHLYQIPRDDVDYIMETFPIVKRKDEARHGEYLTKRVILEMVDQMAALPVMPVPAPKDESATYAVPDVSQWQTWLHPPPAHPSVAHPPRPQG